MSNIAELNFKTHRNRNARCILPNFKSTTAFHVQRKNRMTPMWFSPSVRQHQIRFRLFFKNGNIHSEILSVPFECCMHIRNSDSDLLDAAYYWFCHKKGISNIEYRSELILTISICRLDTFYKYRYEFITFDG